MFICLFFLITKFAVSLEIAFFFFLLHFSFAIYIFLFKLSGRIFTNAMRVHVFPTLLSVYASLSDALHRNCGISACFYTRV